MDVRMVWSVICPKIGSEMKQLAHPVESTTGKLTTFRGRQLSFFFRISYFGQLHFVPARRVVSTRDNFTIFFGKFLKFKFLEIC